MTVPSSTIIIIIVVAFAFYLVYSQNNQPRQVQTFQQVARPHCQRCRHYDESQRSETRSQSDGRSDQRLPERSDPKLSDSRLDQRLDSRLDQRLDQRIDRQPQVTNVIIDQDNDPYSDPIKKQDLHSMYDPLTYPQLRLPREVLEKYNEYYERNGSYPPFNQATQPLFDNPILNGILIKQVDENEPFGDNTIPKSIPLFRVKSSKNTNRFFYYIIDQRSGKLDLKIPLDHVKVNTVRYNNADFYGLPELYDGDTIENIQIYPQSKFKVTLYKTYHFP